VLDTALQLGQQAGPLDQVRTQSGPVQFGLYQDGRSALYFDHAHWPFWAGTSVRDTQGHYTTDLEVPAFCIG
jgi:hypothetical protein